MDISPTPWILDEKEGVASDKGYWLTVKDISKADARLIAAAPKLYKLLAFAVEQYKCETRSCDNCPNGKCWVVDATAALAEAAGESEIRHE